MFGIDGIVVLLLFLAGIHAVGDIALDAIVLARNPKAQAPSLARRRTRAELAQQKAAARVELAEAQTAAGIPPAPGQAAADRIARFIADPPPWPPWVIALVSYLSLLLSDRLAQARRQHVANENARMRGERGKRARHSGPFCDACDVNAVKHLGDMCKSCATVVLDECIGCRALVPVAELRDERCETCRRPTDTPTGTPPEAADPDVPLRLELTSWPSWLPTN
jgi:hypothetical protein